MYAVVVGQTTFLLYVNTDTLKLLLYIFKYCIINFIKYV